MPFNFSKKSFFLGLIFFFMVILSGLLVFYFNRKESPSIQINQNFNQLKNIGATTTSTILTFTDSDHDGLTDNEEKKAGTDPLVSDTDNDELIDSLEVKYYKTDPLNPDSDGDGFTDGKEIKGGYNPKKKGEKLPSSPPLGSGGWEEYYNLYLKN